MSKILIVEDERKIARFLELELIHEGYEVDTAGDGRTGLEKALSWKPDLMILDLMLPELSGIEVCRRLRHESDLPIIMLTAKDDVSDKVMGLDMGADDYMTKPFLPLELMARVKAQLRRYKRYNAGALQDEDVIVHGALVLNSRTHECTLNEKALPLTPTEFSILWILCQEKGNVLSSEELFHRVWGDEYYNKNNNTITVHIRHLREKMGDSFESPKYIKTVWGVGYKIEG